MLKLEVIKENSDGTADAKFNFDKAFEEYYKSVTHKQEINDKEVGEFILKMLEEACGPTPIGDKN